MKIRHLIWAVVILHLVVLAVAAVLNMSSSLHITESQRSELELNDPSKVVTLGMDTIHYPSFSVVRDGKVTSVPVLEDEQSRIAYEGWRKKLSFLGYAAFFNTKWDARIWTPHFIVDFSPDATAFTPTAAPGKEFGKYSRTPTEEDKAIRALILKMGSKSVALNVSR